LPEAKLISALSAVDWNAQIAAFAPQDEMKEIAQACMTLAVWARQLEDAEKGNLALPFIREMQVASHNVAALAGLSLYKAAAASIRTSVECALYYVYFRSHPSELATLVRDNAYYIDKNSIIAYMKVHIPNFLQREQSVNLIGRLNDWYSEISAIVHGQKPGGWASKKAIESTKFDKGALGEMTKKFQEGVQIVDGLFKVALAPEIWFRFSTDAKKLLVKGMPGNQKQVLQLDVA
jgi:hypothetical protein